MRRTWFVGAFLFLLTGAPLAGQPPTANARKLQGRAVCATTPSDTNVLTWDAASSCWKPAAGASGGQLTATFLLCAGPCVANETSNWKWTSPAAVTFTSCTVDAVTYPTGAAITVDILRQGTTTVFSTTVPTLSTGGTTYNTQTGMSAAAALTTGQYLTAKMLTVGSTVAGQFVNLVCKGTY